MVIVKTAPYGEWKSQIGAEAATAGSRSLSSPRVCPETKRTFFLESRTNGTSGIVEVTPDGPQHVLPEKYAADTTVYEYGGLAYTPVSGDRLRIIFNDARGQSLNVIDVDNGTVEPIVQSSSFRYADFDCHPDVGYGTEETAWVLAIEEDHTHPKPEDVRNTVVCINLATKEIKRILEGADFYSYPRFSPDGKTIAWLQWDHPALPFIGVRLFVGDFDDTTASVSNARVIAGDDDESIAEPRWSPDGDLYFCSDSTGFRQLTRFRDGARERILLPGLESAEFGTDSWTVGCQSYVFLTEDTIVAAPVQNGKYQLVYIDLETQDWATLDVPLVEHRMDCLAPLSATAFIAIGSGYTTPRGLYDIEILEDLETEVTLVRSSVDEHFPEAIFSKPVPIRFTTLKAPHREVHGFFWPPHNPRFTAPEGERPPLIISSHGGPTGHTSPGLEMRYQYFTSRGYAYFAINYTGSSGHGKAYREALFGEWGILDRDDAAEAVDYLAWSGRIDRQRVGIEGGSAGGYNTLCSLTWHPTVFAGGVAYCGVSDVKDLNEKTHKLESHYLEVLLRLKGRTPGEQEALFEARSPLYHAESITAPLLLVHGDADVVVPIEQSKEIRRKIRGRGGDAELVVLGGEGHMFKRAESWATIVLEAEKWWKKTLLATSDLGSQ